MASAAERRVKPRGWFITGTDTDAGKTVIAALLTLGLNAHYWKPVQSGAPTDSDCIAHWTGISAERIYPEAWRLPLPASPHWAAQQAGVEIKIQNLHLPPAPAGITWIVEGAGGTLVPLNSHETMADLIRQLGLPVIVVARHRLGAINHTLLTLETLRRREIEVAGVVLNHGPGAEENRISAPARASLVDPLGGNRRAIESFGSTRVLAEIPLLASLTPPVLQQAFDRFLREPLQRL